MIHCNMDTELIKEKTDKKEKEIFEIGFEDILKKKRDKKEKKIFKMQFEDIFFLR